MTGSFKASGPGSWEMGQRGKRSYTKLALFPLLPCDVSRDRLPLLEVDLRLLQAFFVLLISRDCADGIIDSRGLATV